MERASSVGARLVVGLLHGAWQRGAGCPWMNHGAATGVSDSTRRCQCGRSHQPPPSSGVAVARVRLPYSASAACRHSGTIRPHVPERDHGSQRPLPRRRHRRPAPPVQRGRWRASHNGSGRICPPRSRPCRPPVRACGLRWWMVPSPGRRRRRWGTLVRPGASDACRMEHPCCHTFLPAPCFLPCCTACSAGRPTMGEHCGRGPWRQPATNGREDCAWTQARARQRSGACGQGTS